MSRNSLMIAACLALTAVRAASREPKAPPSPVLDSDAAKAGVVKTVPGANGRGMMTVFVGKYGETVELPFDWSVKGVVNGEIETVYFHRKFSDDQSNVPFNPKPSDFKPDNFGRLELMELVVISKSAPNGLRSLQEIRSAKEKEAAAKGMDSEIIVETDNFAWPSGTFRVQTARPYILHQLYTESKNEFFILTSAGRVAAPEFGLSEERAKDYSFTIRQAEESLRKYAIASSDPVHRAGLFVPIHAASEGLFSNFKTLRFIGLFGTLAATMIVLAFWPGASGGARRARLLGRSIFTGAHLTAAVGFLATYLPISFADMRWRCSTDVMLLTFLLAPGVGSLAANSLGLRAGRVASAIGVLSALYAILILLQGRPDDLLAAEESLLGNTVLLYAAGITFGIAFVLSCGQRDRTEGA